MMNEASADFPLAGLPQIHNIRDLLPLCGLGLSQARKFLLFRIHLQVFGTRFSRKKWYS